MIVQIVLALVAVIVLILCLVVFKMLKELTSVYNLIYSRTSGLAVGESVPFIEPIQTKTSGTRVLLFGNKNCTTCQKLLMQVQDEQLHNSVNLTVLYQGSEDESQDYVKKNGFTFPIRAITKEQKALFKIDAEPYAYVVDEYDIIRYKGVLVSSREIVNAHQRVQNIS